MGASPEYVTEFGCLGIECLLRAQTAKMYRISSLKELRGTPFISRRTRLGDLLQPTYSM